MNNIKKLLLTIICTSFCFGIPITKASEPNQYISYSLKLGAGRPGETHPNGKKAYVLNYDRIPYVNSMKNLEEWLYVGGGHYMGAIRAIDMTSTSNIPNEWIQLAFCPPIQEDGTLSTEKTPFSQTFNMLNELFREDNLSKALQETRVVAHLFMPETPTEDAGAVLHIPGSKRVGYTQLKKGERCSKEGIPCFMLDFIGTEDSRSTVTDQLTVSFFARALSILIGHQLLQSLDSVNPHRIVWDTESIGSTQALVALLPEVLSKFGNDFILPCHLAMNDLAPILTSPLLEDSPFWEIPKTIWGGRNDEFTPLDQVRLFLGDYENNPLIILLVHNGYHDARAYNPDTSQQTGGPYDIERAVNYTGLWAHINIPIEAFREAITTAAANGAELDNETIMEAIDPLLEDLRLTLSPEGLELMRDSLLQGRGRKTWLKKFQAAAEEAGAEAWDESMPLPQVSIDLKPTEVPDLLRLLPQGATFGPTSAEEARDLREEVIQTVLQYVRAPDDDISDTEDAAPVASTTSQAWMQAEAEADAQAWEEAGVDIPATETPEGPSGFTTPGDVGESDDGDLESDAGSDIVLDLVSTTGSLSASAPVSTFCTPYPSDDDESAPSLPSTLDGDEISTHGRAPTLVPLGTLSFDEVDENMPRPLSPRVTSPQRRGIDDGSVPSLASAGGFSPDDVDENMQQGRRSQSESGLFPSADGSRRRSSDSLGLSRWDDNIPRNGSANSAQNSTCTSPREDTEVAAPLNTTQGFLNGSGSVGRHHPDSEFPGELSL